MSQDDFTHLRLLIADDDPVLRMIMCQVFEPLGFTVFQAENGAQAWEIFESILPDLVILDVKMPEISGFEVCEKIRACPEGYYTPVLITTGLDDDASIHRAYEVGATDFILKPFNWTIINHRIKYILRSAQVVKSLNEMRNKNEALINAFPDKVFSFENINQAKSFDDLKIYQNQLNTTQGFDFPEFFKENLMHHIQLLKKPFQIEVFQYSQHEMNEKRFYEVRLIRENQNSIIGIIRDITDIKKFELQLKEYAFYDELTSLPNRQHLNRTLQKMVDRPSDYEGLSIYFIDLDRFKKINDTFGHTIGDRILKTIATQLDQKIDEILRSLNLKETPFLARFGGDEFVLVIPHVTHEDMVGSIAQQILDFFESPVVCQGRDFYITPSIGISVYPENGANCEVLLKNADIAMYYSKQEGRNTFHIYKPKMSTDDVARLDLENALRKAIDCKELILEYQPQYLLNTVSVYGVEALVRWNHPELGIISPVAFIPIAEEIGLINQIGHFVLEAACQQFALWQQQGIDLNTFSINLSPSDLRDRALPTRIFDLLSEYNLNPSSMTIELTESIFMDKDSICLDVLKRIGGLGVQIAIDDFGKGYSSLSYLKHFPVNYLKIDKSFIEHVNQNQSDRDIVKAMVKMAHALSLKVVAEGVENKEQYEFLQQEECDFIQGFYFAKPMSAQGISELVKNSKAKNQSSSQK